MTLEETISSVFNAKKRVHKHTIIKIISEITNSDISTSKKIEYLSHQSNNYLTFGHCIARHQDAQTTQAYVALLKTLLEKEDVDAKAMYALLSLQDEYGQTFSSFIARFQDTKTTQAYIDLLTTLLEKEDVDANAMYALLSLQNVHGWHNIAFLLMITSETRMTFGSYIASYKDAKTTQAYVGLLRTLLKKGIVDANAMYALLSLRDDINGFRFTFGHLIASYQDAKTTQAYLDLLTTLLGKEDVNADAMYALLSLQDKDGSTFGDLIVRYKDAKITKAYLDLLTTLLGKEDVNADAMYALLSLQNKDGSTFGDLIVRYKDAKTTKAYLDLLTTLLGKEDVNADAMYALLSLQNKDGSTFGDLIVRYKDAKTTKAYLDLLTTLLGKEDVNADAMYALLSLQNKDGSTFGDLIVRYKDAKTTKAYLDLLTTLLGKENVSAKAIYALLKLEDKDGLTFGDFIVRGYQDAQTKQAYLEFLEETFGYQDGLATDIFILLKPFKHIYSKCFKAETLGFLNIYKYFSNRSGKLARRDDFLSFFKLLKGEESSWTLEACKSKFGSGFFTARYYDAMVELSAALGIKDQDKKNIIIKKLAEIERLFNIKSVSTQPSAPRGDVKRAPKEEPSAPPPESKSSQHSNSSGNTTASISAKLVAQSAPGIESPTRTATKPKPFSKIKDLIKDIKALGVDLDKEKDLEGYGLDEYICPITLCLMRDPVTTTAGQIYDRAAITEHFDNSGMEIKDPLTNKTISSALIGIPFVRKQLIEKLETLKKRLLNEKTTFKTPSAPHQGHLAPIKRTPH